MNPSNPKPFGTPEPFLMGVSSVENTLYLCVAKGSSVLHSYSAQDPELEALAAVCLQNAPPFHSWYFHTDGARTFGFLMEDGYTYFAIADPSSGSSATLRLLQNIRDGFKKASKSGVHDELVPVLRSLITSLESMSGPGDRSDQSASSDGPASTDGPLLGSSSSRSDMKAVKDRVVEPTDRTVRIDMSPESAVGAVSLQKCSSSSSGSRVRGQQMGQRLWCRHIKMVIAADALLCLVLFGVWMAVCRGFQCVSS